MKINLPEPPVPAIQVQEVSKRFGAVQALDGITLAIPRGELFGLLGPNGAGKSTLINILTGLARPSAGSVKVFGYDVALDSLVTRSLIGAVPQELVYDHFFTVRQSLQIQSGYFGVTRNQEWLEYLLNRLELREHAHKTIRELSGGMKRRLLVAKAMVHRPPVLILDEPTAGVDVALRRSLWELVREIHHSGSTVLLTTHYLDEAEELCERIGIIHRGVFVALDRKEALMRQIHNRKVHLEFSTPQPGLPQDLVELGGTLAKGGLQATVLVDRSNGTLQRLMEILARCRLPLADLQVSGAGLEDVFLELTADPAADTLPPPGGENP